MAESKIAGSLEKLVNNAGRLVGNLQVGVNKILWGRANTQPVTSVQYGPTPESNGQNVLSYSSQIRPTPERALEGRKFKKFAESGLFNIMDALNAVDLCEILNYAYDNINLKKKPRKENPQGFEKTFYAIQDAAGVVVTQIDKYTAYPNIFIGSYLGTGDNAIPPVIAAQNTNAPIQGGTQVQKYNTFFLMQAIKETLLLGSQPNSLITPEEVGLLSSVPGLASKINFIKDFNGIIDEYTDYTQIPDERLQVIISKINEVRYACTAIQSLSFKDPRALLNVAANYLGVDIRSQIQKLGEFVKVTEIIPTLKQINNALQAFIRICRQVQGIINLGQFFIKIAILFYKIFKFIFLFFGLIPIPSMFITAGAQTKLQDAKNAAKAETDGVMRILRGINALLSVVVVFVEYLLVNTVELLARMEILLSKIRTCDTLKDSDILFELEKTNTELLAVKEQLETYIINVRSKTSPDSSEFGKYQIRVVDEQVVENTVTNRRRRGIALDANGAIVTQSDLTFATNTTVIIEEVKQKLVSLGLVQPSIPRLDAESLAIISESLGYLDNNDVLDDNLNITNEASLDGLTEGEEGIGLQSFINNLKGGRKLRRAVRTKLAANQTQFRTQVAQEKQTAEASISNTINPKKG